MDQEIIKQIEMVKNCHAKGLTTADPIEEKHPDMINFESSSDLTKFLRPHSNQRRNSAVSTYNGKRTQASTVSLTFGGDSVHNHHSLNRYHLVSAQKHLRNIDIAKSLKE